MSLLSSFDLRDSLSFTAIALHKEKLEGSIPFSTLNSLNIVHSTKNVSFFSESGFRAKIDIF